MERNRPNALERLSDGDRELLVLMYLAAASDQNWSFEGTGVPKPKGRPGKIVPPKRGK